MQILVGVGGSNHSEIALRQASILAQKQPLSATILTVIKDSEDETEAISRLQVAARFLRAAVPNVAIKVRIGNAAEQIVEEALSAEYELLVIGERPQHKLLTRLWGPTALRIVAKQPCPILIAKEQPHPLEQILVCDSVYAEPNLSVRFADRFPELLAQARSVNVLHVMSQIAAAPGVHGQQLRADVEQLMSDHAPEGDVLAQDVQLLSEGAVNVEPIVRRGLVIEEILAEVTNGHYDLIVIGAHPHQGWQRFLLEDITAQIVLQADRPILVIP